MVNQMLNAGIIRFLLVTPKIKLRKLVTGRVSMVTSDKVSGVSTRLQGFLLVLNQVKIKNQGECFLLSPTYE